MGVIKIRLELFAFLEKFYPKESSRRPCIMQVAGDATARALLRGLKMPDDIPVLVYHNDKQIPENEDRDLRDGDTVGVMPVIPGG